MTNAYNKALDAVSNAAPQSKQSSLPDLRHGQPVVRLGGDGTIYYIKGFYRAGRGRYMVRLMREDCLEVQPVAAHLLKPADHPTLH